MKIHILILIAILFSIHAFSQAEKSDIKNSSSFCINLSVKQYIVSNKDVEIFSGDSKINLRNTNGYQIGLSYQFENKRNMLFCNNIAFGTQQHSANWNINLNEVIPNTTFENPYYNIKETYNIQYFQTSFLLGYGYTIPKNKNLTIQALAGIGLNSYINSIRSQDSYLLTIADPQNPNFIGDPELVRLDIDLGSDLANGKFFALDDVNLNPFYQFNIGLKYNKSISYFNSINIHFIYSSFFNKINPIDKIRVQYYDYQGNNIGAEQYNNMFRSLAISLGLGF